MGMKINNRVYRKKIKKLQKYAKTRLPRDTLKFFKDATPIDGGNARRNTRLTKKRDGFSISGDYDYSGVIDRGEYPKNPITKTGKTIRGYSTQSPRGMTIPAGKFVEKEVRNFIKRI